MATSNPNGRRKITPLRLSIGTEIRNIATGATGRVVDQQYEGIWIGEAWREWPIYTVQFAGHSYTRTARQWAQGGFEVKV